jgi:hypothetical protein
MHLPNICVTTARFVFYGLAYSNHFALHLLNFILNLAVIAQPIIVSFTQTYLGAG